MSKAQEQLRKSGIYNDHGIVHGQETDYFVTFTPYASRTATCGWHLCSTRKKWPGAWYHHGAFSISADGAKDYEKALAIASKECGVTRWAPSPFSPRTAFVPASALEAHGIKPSRIIETPTPKEPGHE